MCSTPTSPGAPETEQDCINLSTSQGGRPQAARSVGRMYVGSVKDDPFTVESKWEKPAWQTTRDNRGIKRPAPEQNLAGYTAEEEQHAESATAPETKNKILWTHMNGMVQS